MAVSDLAEIGFAARTDGLLKATKGLNDLRGAAKDAQVTMDHLESTTGKTNSRLSETRQKLNPAYRAMVEYRGKLREISVAARQGAISETEAANARRIARHGAEQTIGSYNRLITTTRGHTAAARANAMALHAQAAAARSTSHMSRQLSFQLVDIGQALATAPTMGIYALQNLGFQVAQIGQLYMGQGGFNQAVKDSAAQVATFAARLGPAAIAVGVLALALVGLQNEIEATTGASVSLKNVAIATFQEIAASVMNTASPAFQWLGRVVNATGGLILSGLRLVGNSIINTFEFSYLAVVATWKMLPSAMGDAVFSAAGAVVDGVEKMVNDSLSGLRRLVDSIPTELRPDWLEGFGEVNLPDVTNPFAGAMDEMTASYEGAYSVFENDRLGDLFDRVGERARNMGDDVEGATGSLNGFQTAVQNIQRATEDLWTQGNFFGEENRFALLEYQKTQHLLNAAMDAGVRITDQVRSQIAGLASEYVSAAQNLDLLKEAQRAYEEVVGFARDTTRNFITDMRNGLEEGRGFWGSFADAALNAINRVTDRLLDQLLDAVFQVNGAFGGMGGNAGGAANIFSSLFNSFGGFFASGGTLGAGQWGIAGERGPEPIVGPATIIPNHVYAAANSNYSSGGTSVVRIELGEGLEGRLLTQAAGNTVQIVDGRTPSIVNQSVAATGGAIKSGSLDAPMGRRFGISQTAKAR